LFDRLIGAGEQGGRDRQPDFLGGLQIDREPVFGRLVERQIPGFVAIQSSRIVPVSPQE
jgi:hypothetical protein